MELFVVRDLLTKSLAFIVALELGQDANTEFFILEEGSWIAHIVLILVRPDTFHVSVMILPHISVEYKRCREVCLV